MGFSKWRNANMKLVGAPARSGIPGISHITWKTIANSYDIPRFLAETYASAKQGTTTPTQRQTTRAYLEKLTGKSLGSKLFDNMNITLDVLFEYVNEAMVNCAQVVGQVISATPGPIAQEVLFYIFSFVSEAIFTQQKVDAETYLREAGHDMAKYLTGMIKSASPLPFQQIISDIRKSPTEIVAWFAAMLDSNVHLVYLSMVALAGVLQETLSHRTREFITICEPHFQRFDLITTLEETIVAAQSVENGLDTDELTRERLHFALAEVQRVHATYGSSGSAKGMVDPWMTASLMGQMYRGENVDEKLVELIVWSRFGESAEHIFDEIDRAITLLMGELWTCLAATASDGKAEHAKIQEEIVRIEGIWDWITGRKKKEEKKDEKKEEKDDKGKEEATPSEIEEFERRQAERVRMERIRLEAREAIARGRGARGAYDPSIQTIDERQIRISKLRAELLLAQEALYAERVRMQHVTMNVQNDNNALIVAAHRASITHFTTMDNPERQAIDTMRSLGRMGSEVERAVNDTIRIAEEQVEQLEYEIAILESGVRIQQKQINRRTMNLGLWILFVAGVGILLYYLWKADSDLMSVTYVPIMKTLTDRAKESGTSSFLQIWINEWKSSARINTLLTPLTPAVINERINKAVVGLINYSPELLDWNRDTLIQVIRDYQSFTRDYVAGLMGSISDVKIYMEALIASGAEIDSDRYKAHAFLLDVLNQAAAMHQQAATMPNINVAEEPGVIAALISKRLDAIQNAAHHIAGAFQLLLTKLWTGALPNIAPDNVSFWQMFQALPSTFITNLRNMASAASVIGAMNQARAFFQSRVPSGGTLSPAGLYDVAIGVGGRSEAWLAALDAVGKAVISIGVGTFGIVMITLFSLTHWLAQLTVGRVNPITYTMQMVPHTISLLKLLWSTIFTDVADAARAQSALSWTSLLSLSAIALVLFPQFGVLSRIFTYVNNRVPERFRANPPSAAPAQPAQPALPAVSDVPQQPATPPPVQRIEPAPPILFFPTQAREPVAEIPMLQTNSDGEMAVIPAITEENRRLAVENRARRKAEKEFQKKQSDLNGNMITCSICAQPATLQCGHCYGKVYCDSVCARADWSAERGNHK
jgi:hypothetical protein